MFGSNYKQFCKKLNLFTLQVVAVASGCARLSSLLDRWVQIVGELTNGMGKPKCTFSCPTFTANCCVEWSRIEILNPVWKSVIWKSKYSWMWCCVTVQAYNLSKYWGLLSWHSILRKVVIKCDAVSHPGRVEPATAQLWGPWSSWHDFWVW